MTEDNDAKKKKGDEKEGLLERVQRKLKEQGSKEAGTLNIVAKNE